MLSFHTRRGRARAGSAPAVGAVLGLLMSPVLAQNPTEDRIRQLELMVHELSRQVKEKDQKVTELETKVQRLIEPRASEQARAQASKDALDAMLQDLRADPSGQATASPGLRIGAANLRLIDVSLDVMATFGGSTATDEQLETLQGGHHDPKKRGFTFQQAELSLMGAVDPFVHGQAHLVVNTEPITNETVVELEEAYLTTQQLPWNLQVKAGLFFTEFGRINPVHPHAWAWIDQPVIATRVFGGDGMRQTGARVSWLAPLPWFSELLVTVQNANGETMPTFLGEGEAGEALIGGYPGVDAPFRSADDLMYAFRWVHALELSDELSLALGGSGAVGPNATGADGRTWLYGGDVVFKWKPVANNRGWPFVTWQTEFIGRHYDVDAQSYDPDETPATGDEFAFGTDTLHDWGLYTQLLWGLLPQWAAGARYEYASGSGDSLAFDAGSPVDSAFIARDDDGTRDDRHRISPLLIWQPTEFTRLRLQYNYDHLWHLEDRDAHSIWFTIEFLLGAHPAHSY